MQLAYLHFINVMVTFKIYNLYLLFSLLFLEPLHKNHKMKSHIVYLTCLLLAFFNSFAQSSERNRGVGPQCFCIPVGVTVQPVSSAPGCINNSVHQFTVSVCGTGPFTYQWKENSVNIFDGGMYSGTHTATLTIANPSFALDQKRYRCVVTNCNGNAAITDNNALINVKALDSHINKDGVTNNSDMLMLNQNFNSPCVSCPADINADGLIDNIDFLRLLGQFYQVCY